jgi:hypothetical protein
MLIWIPLRKVFVRPILGQHLEWNISEGDPTLRCGMEGGGFCPAPIHWVNSITRRSRPLKIGSLCFSEGRTKET